MHRASITNTITREDEGSYDQGENKRDGKKPRGCLRILFFTIRHYRFPIASYIYFCILSPRH